MRFPRLTVALALLTIPALGATSDCDRDCLRDLITQYLAAMLTHNPAALSLGDQVHFTEDGVTLKPGEGLWKSMSKVRGYREDFLDVRQRVAAAFVVVEDNGTPALFVLRLKTAEGRSPKLKPR